MPRGAPSAAANQERDTSSPNFHSSRADVAQGRGPKGKPPSPRTISGKKVGEASGPTGSEVDISRDLIKRRSAEFVKQEVHRKEKAAQKAAGGRR